MAVRGFSFTVTFNKPLKANAADVHALATNYEKGKGRRKKKP
jgi:hypothetical protein